MHQATDLSMQGIMDVALRVDAYGTVVRRAHHLPFVIQVGSSHKRLCSSVMACAYWLKLLYVWTHTHTTC